MSSHSGIDFPVLCQYYPHIVDDIILFSNTETHIALRRTCQVVRQYVDALRCRQLHGTSWFFDSVGETIAIEVDAPYDHDSDDHSNDNSDMDSNVDADDGSDEESGDDSDSVSSENSHKKPAFRSELYMWALYDWEDPSVCLPGLEAAPMIFIHNPPPTAMDVLSQRASPTVYVYLYHNFAQAYCPLDNCRRVFIEVDPFKCLCNPAQPIDYRLRAPEVVINLSPFKSIIPIYTRAQNPSPDTEVSTSELPSRIKTPRLTIPTSCCLLNQVLHPGLRFLELREALPILDGETPALLFPKPAAGVKLPDTFKMVIQPYYGMVTSSEKAVELRNAFAEHLGVDDTQVVFEY